MFTNGQWKPAVALAEFTEVVFTATVALLVQFLFVATTLRLAVTASSVSAQLYICSTDHWLNEPEKMNKYDVSTNVLNTYFSASNAKKKIFKQHFKKMLLFLY